MDDSNRSQIPAELVVSRDWRGVMLDEHNLVAKFDLNFMLSKCNANLRAILGCENDSKMCKNKLEFLDERLSVVGNHILKNRNNWKGKIRLFGEGGSSFLTNGTLQRFTDENTNNAFFVLVMDVPEECFIRSIKNSEVQSEQVFNEMTSPFSETRELPSELRLNDKKADFDLQALSNNISIEILELEQQLKTIFKKNNTSRSQSLIISVDGGIPYSLEPLNEQLNSLIYHAFALSVLNTPYGVVAVHLSYDKYDGELHIDIDDTGEPINRQTLEKSDDISTDYLQQVQKIIESAPHIKLDMMTRSSGNTFRIKAQCHVASQRFTMRNVTYSESNNSIVNDFENDRQYRQEFKSNLEMLLIELENPVEDETALRHLLHMNTPSLFYWNQSKAYAAARHLHESIRNDQKSVRNHYKTQLKQEITHILASL